MHYVDFNSKTKQTIVRFATYGIVGLVAFVISVIIVYAARGYDVDPSTGQVIRNGLVLLWSQPEAVDVYVDDVLEEGTPARLPLPNGEYQLKMSKEGYRDWNKTVVVDGSEVVKINYPRLFPNEITATSAANMPQVKFWTQSPDQELLVIHQGNQPRVLNMYDVNQLESEPVQIIIPIAQLTSENGAFGELEYVQWSADSRYLILKHTIGSVIEFIRIDVEQNRFINLNKTLSQPLRNVQFDRSENDFIYAQIRGQLRRINIRNETIEPPLASDIADYRVVADGRLVAMQLQKQRTNVLLIEDEENIETILRGPRTSSAQVELGNFENEDYAVVSISPNTAQIVWLDEKLNRKPVAAIIRGKNLEVHPVSFTGRFALISSGNTLTVHDFDKLRVHRFEATDIDIETLTWFDDGHLVGVANGKTVIYEFDGQNYTELGQSLNYKTYTDQPFENFFTLGQGANNTVNLNFSNLRPPSN